MTPVAGWARVAGIVRRHYPKSQSPFLRKTFLFCQFTKAPPESPRKCSMKAVSTAPRRNKSPLFLQPRRSFPAGRCSARNFASLVTPPDPIWPPPPTNDVCVSAHHDGEKVSAVLRGNAISQSAALLLSSVGNLPSSIASSPSLMANAVSLPHWSIAIV